MLISFKVWHLTESDNALWLQINTFSSFALPEMSRPVNNRWAIGLHDPFFILKIVVKLIYVCFIHPPTNAVITWIGNKFIWDTNPWISWFQIMAKFGVQKLPVAYFGTIPNELLDFLTGAIVSQENIWHTSYLFISQLMQNSLTVLFLLF